MITKLQEYKTLRVKIYYKNKNVILKHIILIKIFNSGINEKEEV